MSADPYSERVRELFAEPAHVGHLPDGAGIAVIDQGIRLQLSAAHDEGVVRTLRFRVTGCPHVIAACELFCSSFEGRPATELREFHAADIMTKLSVPVEKTGRILVVEDAVRSLGRAIGDQATSSTQ
jgi:NifU-like protein involved in Fe-S cluster formation